MGLALVPRLFTEDKIKLAGTIGIYAIIALSLVVLTGWAGQVSLGQMGFVGVAGAVSGTLANRWHWDIALILLVAGAVGASTTVIIGLPTLRARLAFAVMTLAFSLATTFYFLNVGYSPVKSWVPNGPVERTRAGSVLGQSETAYYTLVLVVLGICLFMVRSLRESRIGRVLIGVRDNEQPRRRIRSAAAALISPLRPRASWQASRVGSSSCSGALGATSFSPAEGLAVFSMVVVGGLGSIGERSWRVLREGPAVLPHPARVGDPLDGRRLLLILLLMPGGLGAAIGGARRHPALHARARTSASPACLPTR